MDDAAMRTSKQLDSEIERLLRLKAQAKNREEISRCKKIFGDSPSDYSEEAFAMVARVYVLRAYKRDDLRDKYLPDHEWIRLWHKYEPKATVHELYEVAQEYIGGGCGFSG